MGYDCPYCWRYSANGARPCAMTLKNSFLKNVFVVGSTGTCVIFLHGSCSTIDAASGSQRKLNSRRGALAYSAAKALSAATGLKLPPMQTSSLASEANCESTLAAIARLVRG